MEIEEVIKMHHRLTDDLRSEMFVEYREAVLQALKKQIPKRVEMNRDLNYDTCPACEGMIQDSYTFCPDCGQKLIVVGA